MDAEEFTRRINEVLRRFSADLRADNSQKVLALDEKPEVRVYLDLVGAASIEELSPAQRREMTDLIFRAMNLCVHPGAN